MTSSHLEVSLQYKRKLVSLHALGVQGACVLFQSDFTVIACIRQKRAQHCIHVREKGKSRVGVQTYMQTYMRAYMHTYIHTDRHTYIHTYIHTYVRT